MANFIKDNAVIVVGVDYSQNSNDALKAAFGLVGTRAEVAIHLVRVIKAGEGQPFTGMTEPFAATAVPAVLDELQAERKELEGLAQRAAASLEQKGAHLFGHLRNGNVAREIVQLASDVSADLIVIGTHGRTGVMKLLLGSVAQNVLTNASCAVLVVKPEGLPRWPEIEPPCPDCVAIQRSSRGRKPWCERHSQHHASAHTYSEYADGYGLGSQTFRGLS